MQLISVGVEVNGLEHEFVVGEGDDWAYWGNLFCARHGIGGEDGDGGCARALEESVREKNRARGEEGGDGVDEVTKAVLGFDDGEVAVALYHHRQLLEQLCEGGNECVKYGGEMSREWSMLEGGVEAHPNVRLVEVAEKADMLVCVVPPASHPDDVWWCPPLGKYFGSSGG